MGEGSSAFKVFTLLFGAFLLTAVMAPEFTSGHFDPLRLAKGKNRTSATSSTTTSTTSTTSSSTTPTTTTTNALYTEASAITSNFDVSTTLRPAWDWGGIPGSAYPDNVGAFRFICGAGQLSYDDPIVYPGQPGRSHLHQFYGNTSANAYSTFDSLRKNGDSTCNNMGNGTAANRSAYWMPAMLVGSGQVWQPNYVSIYYKRIPKTNPACGKLPSEGGVGYCVPIPNGLRFVFGYDMVAGTPPTGAVGYRCPNRSGTNAPSIPAAIALCQAGDEFEITINAPACWDGVNLDSANHRSHMAYQWGACPATHPYLIPTFTMSVFYTVTQAVLDASRAGTLRLSSDDMHPELPRGTTFHADYFEGWDTSVKAMWTDNCIDKLLNCSGGDLGNGKQLIGAQNPSYGWRNPAPITAKP